MKMKFRNRYENKKVVTDCACTPTRTQKSFQRSADINNIVSRYTKSGILATDPSSQPTRQMIFQDLRKRYDFYEVNKMVSAARSEFELLPSADRAKFANSVEVFVDWLSDPSNMDDAIENGYIPDNPDEQTEVKKIEPEVVQKEVPPNES